MRRRSFLSSAAALLLKDFQTIAPLPEVSSVCGLCHQPGHKMEGGSIRPKNPEEWTQLVSIAVWCPNAPVDWTFYEKC